MQAALKWGALVGAASYIVAGLAIPLLAGALFGTPDLSNPGVLTFGCLGIFVLLFGFSAAGYWTGRETLKAGMGAVGGIVALAVYAVLTRLYTPHVHAVSATAATAKVTPAGGNAVGQAVAALVADAFVLGLAALMGWLGGRPGAQNARRAREAATPGITRGGAN
jgi:hypothetical protein